MKKITIALTALTLCTFGFVGCAKTNSNSKLAKSIEEKSTELVYSVESMNELEIADLDEAAVQQTSKIISANAAIINNENTPTTKTINNENTNNIQSTSKLGKTNKIKTNLTKHAKSNSKSNTDIKLTTTDFGNMEDYSQDLIEKRAEVMLLCSKMRKGDIAISKENKEKIDQYLDLIESTSTHLEKTKTLNKNADPIKATMAEKIALRERIAIRQAKLQTSILAMDEIINILREDDNNNAEQNSTQTKNTINDNTKKGTNNVINNTIRSTTNPNNLTNTATNNKNTNNKSTNTSNKTKSGATNNTTKNTTNNQISNTTQNRNKIENKPSVFSLNKRYYPNRNTNYNTNNQTTQNKEDAVSIIVKPIQTQTNTNCNQQTNTNKNQARTTEYIINAKKQDPNDGIMLLKNNKMKSLPKASNMPYETTQTFENLRYSA